MKSRSFTIIAVFFAVMLVVVVIRILLHPVQSVSLFIEHKDDAAWSPALSNTLFQEASIDFAGYQPIQLAGDDRPLAVILPHSGSVASSATMRL